MGLYTVSQSSLAPIAGVHNGTGHQHDPGRAVAVAGSVPGSTLLQFSGMDLSITTMLFVLNANVVPNWFGVAVPDGLTDFTRPNIFFHPTPGQAGYNDADYPTKGGQWPKLFYYMERLGYQIAGSGRGQVVVMPFLTDAATSTGILPANWQDIITDILQAASTQLQPGQPVPASIAQVVVSSFSDGILYSHSFRATGAGLQPLLGEIWDLDGSISTVSQYSADLRHGQSVPVVQYRPERRVGYHELSCALAALGRLLRHVGDPEIGIGRASADPRFHVLARRDSEHCRIDDPAGRAASADAPNAGTPIAGTPIAGTPIAGTGFTVACGAAKSVVTRPAARAAANATHPGVARAAIATGAHPAAAIPADTRCAAACPAAARATGHSAGWGCAATACADPCHSADDHARRAECRASADSRRVLLRGDRHNGDLRRDRRRGDHGYHGDRVTRQMNAANRTPACRNGGKSSPRFPRAADEHCSAGQRTVRGPPHRTSAPDPTRRNPGWTKCCCR